MQLLPHLIFNMSDNREGINPTDQSIPNQIKESSFGDAMPEGFRSEVQQLKETGQLPNPEFMTDHTVRELKGEQLANPQEQSVAHKQIGELVQHVTNTENETKEVK